MMPPCFSFHAQTCSRNFSRPEIVPVLHDPLLAQGLFDHRLGGDAGVVGARQPEHLLAIHARFAGQDVLDRVVQHMAHVEHAGDVRRRDDDRVGRLGRSRDRRRNNLLFSQKSYHFSSTACGS